MALCKCDDLGLGNTGLPNCQPLMGVDTLPILVPTYDSTGVKNTVPDGTVVDQAYLDARLNDADASKRWYPLTKIENATSERADAITETSAGGTNARIKSGVRTESFEIWKQSPTLISKLEEAQCTDFSVFVVDNNGSLIGMCLDSSGDLFPVRIDKNTLDVKYTKATDTTVAKIVLSYQWAEVEKDSDLSMIAEGEITADLLSAKGLLDINSTFSNVGQTSLEVKLETEYGSKSNKVKDSGLLAGDFTLFNVTDSLAVAIISSTETASGCYTLTYASQDVAEVLQLTPSKAGRDYTSVVADVQTIA